MRIQQLSLHVEEQDLNTLARKYRPDDFPVENLQFQISTEGLRISGEFLLFLPVRFQTLWELGIQQGKVTARLVSINAAGVPITVFRSMILKMIQESAGAVSWLEYENDLLVANINKLAEKEGVPVEIRLQSILCQAGILFVTAGE